MAEGVEQVRQACPTRSCHRPVSVSAGGPVVLVDVLDQRVPHGGLMRDMNFEGVVTVCVFGWEEGRTTSTTDAGPGDDRVARLS
jgi:hypothetical protein